MELLIYKASAGSGKTFTLTIEYILLLLQDEQGEYTHEKAALHYNKHILDEKDDNLMELTYKDRKRIHNLKYYTWVEQQGKTVDEINALWYDEANTWGALRKERAKVDELINEFNEATGLLKKL